MEPAEVLAAGGVVVRDRGGGLEVLLVHRPKYDDWSFPKGKLDPGEAFEQAALREVREETGLTCRIGRSLSPIRYRDARGRAKEVRYWLMEVVSGEIGSRPADLEVDELRWISPVAAGKLLTYGRDRDLLDEVVGSPAVSDD